MADLRVTGGLTPPPSTGPANRSDAARAAQRAFFQAALNGTAAPAATPPAVKAAPPAKATPAPAAANPAAEPTRYARPGSRLDIRV